MSGTLVGVGRRRSRRSQIGWADVGAFFASFLFRHRRPIGIVFGIYCAFTVPVNLCVQALGGGPSLLSPYHYTNKLRALMSFAIHWPTDLFFDHESPEVLLERAAKKHRIPVSLALAVAHTESRMIPHRVSHAGAMGIMQLMPDTADHLDVSDPFDSEQSIDGGVRYLAELWRRYRGDCTRTIAAYNAGPGAVPRTGPLDLPGETTVYLRRVLGKGSCQRR